MLEDQEAGSDPVEVLNMGHKSLVSQSTLTQTVALRIGTSSNGQCGDVLAGNTNSIQLNNKSLFLGWFG